VYTAPLAVDMTISDICDDCTASTMPAIPTLDVMIYELVL